MNQGPDEVGDEFFCTTDQRTGFGMVFMFKTGDGELKELYFDIISECLGHNAYFVKKAHLKNSFDVSKD